MKKKTISQLTPNPRNPRKISDKQMAMLKKSLVQFGDLSGFIVNVRSGNIVSGHQRQKALPPDAEIVITDRHKEPTKTGTVSEGHILIDGEKFKYREVDWDEVTEKAGNLAANKHGGDFDLSILNEWLLELDAHNIDMDLVGFTKEELEGLMAPITVVPGKGEPDHIPSLPKVHKSARGDIFILGDHRLMCGDSSSITDVELLMDGKKSDMVFTDPPYGVSYQSNMRTKSDKFEVIEGDDSFMSEWVDVLPIVSKGWVFVWTTWKVIDEWIEITKPIGEMSNVIIWDKGGGGIGDLEKTFSTDYEMALVFHRGAKITGKRLGSVWSIGKDGASTYLHPTQKPVALAEMAIENCTKKGNLILDLFGGSGTTLIACQKTGRKCYMMEMDQNYIDLIINRWCEFTGGEAHRLEEDGSKIAWSDIAKIN